MYFTGFADEAAKNLDQQIAATKKLGWSCIESRAIDGVNIHDLSDEAFDVAAGQLEDADIRVGVGLRVDGPTKIVIPADAGTN